MLVAVSPYHLTTREAPALAALLLAERVVTLLPSPLAADGPEAVERAVERIPRYLSFMRSWEWSMPLWRAGVVSSVYEGEDPAEDVRSVCRRIAGDDRLTALRPLFRDALFEDEERYLDRVAADLLKGGPDPAVSLPVAAGIDRFAIRHGLMVARSQAASVAQRAEERMGRRLFAAAAPVLIQAGGARVLEARRRLAPQLGRLRAAFAEAWDEACTGHEDAPGPPSQPPGLRAAARAYALAFEDQREEITGPDDEDEARVVEGMVSLTAVALPGDAVLRSSVSAMRVLGAQEEGDAQSRSAPGALALRDEAEGRRVVGLLVKVLGRGIGGARAGGRWGAA